jgi:hypothetical protein
MIVGTVFTIPCLLRRSIAFYCVRKLPPIAASVVNAWEEKPRGWLVLVLTTKINHARASWRYILSLQRFIAVCNEIAMHPY